VDAGGKAYPEWTQSNGGGAKYCKWPGVACEGSDVVGISIHSRGGMPSPWGSLPPAPALQDLPRLKWLKINSDGWGIKGKLPADYGKLTGLQELVLTVDGYGGSIPPEWSGMSSLKRLVLKYSNLTGTLPESFGGMKQLQELNLTINSLTGSLPSRWSGMSSLKTLDIRWVVVVVGVVVAQSECAGSRRGQGWPSSSRSGCAWYLQVALTLTPTNPPPSYNDSMNGISGTLPPSYSSLYNLEVMELSSNPDLGGTLPKEWAGMKSLRSFIAA